MFKPIRSSYFNIYDPVTGDWCSAGHFCSSSFPATAKTLLAIRHRFLIYLAIRWQCSNTHHSPHVTVADDPLVLLEKLKGRVFWKHPTEKKNCLFSLPCTPSEFLRSLIYNSLSQIFRVHIPILVWQRFLWKLHFAQKTSYQRHSDSVSEGQTTVWKVKQVPDSWWDPVLLQTMATWGVTSVQNWQAVASVVT